MILPMLRIVHLSDIHFGQEKKDIEFIPRTSEINAG